MKSLFIKVSISIVTLSMLTGCAKAPKFLDTSVVRNETLIAKPIKAPGKRAVIAGAAGAGIGAGAKRYDR